MNINEQLKNEFKEKYFEFHDFELENMIFEERVKINCFHCKHYGNKHTCPPKVNVFDYNKIFSEYENALVVHICMPYEGEEEFQQIRSLTTNSLHKKLLKMEKFLWDKNNSLATSFIGGSCKLCKDGCDLEKCRFPYLSRIPWEATGVNIVKTLDLSLGIKIDFTLNNLLSRYGLLVW